MKKRYILQTILSVAAVMANAKNIQSNVNNPWDEDSAKQFVAEHSNANKHHEVNEMFHKNAILLRNNDGKVELVDPRYINNMSAEQENNYINFLKAQKREILFAIAKNSKHAQSQFDLLKQIFTDHSYELKQLKEKLTNLEEYNKMLQEKNKNNDNEIKAINAKLIKLDNHINKVDALQEKLTSLETLKQKIEKTLLNLNKKNFLQQDKENKKNIEYVNNEYVNNEYVNNEEVTNQIKKLNSELEALKSNFKQEIEKQIKSIAPTLEKLMELASKIEDEKIEQLVENNSLKSKIRELEIQTNHILTSAEKVLTSNNRNMQKTLSNQPSISISPSPSRTYTNTSSAPRDDLIKRNNSVKNVNNK